MTAARTFEAWKLFSAGHGIAGGSNCFTHAGASYSFDAHPRELGNGAIQGRIYRQAHGENAVDIGWFKIDAHGDVVAIPDELRDVLPMRAPAASAERDFFSCDDVPA